MNNLQLTFPCAVDSQKLAVADSLHFRMVNYEFFFLSSPEAVYEFDSDPIRYCGILTDPVTRQRFYPGDNSPSTMRGEHRYFFVSDSSKAVFAAMPDMFAMPNYEMLPKTDSLVPAQPTLPNPN